MGHTDVSREKEDCSWCPGDTAGRLDPGNRGDLSCSFYLFICLTNREILDLGVTWFGMLIFGGMGLP